MEGPQTEALDYDTYMKAVEVSKDDARLADLLRRYEQKNMEVQHKNAEYQELLNEFVNMEYEITRYMRVREV